MSHQLRKIIFNKSKIDNFISHYLYYYVVHIINTCLDQLVEHMALNLVAMGSNFHGWRSLTLCNM